MKRSVIETVLGAVVLCLAGFFLVFSYKTAHVRKVSGYEITASFSGTGGLNDGDDVRISGVRIGSVDGLQLDQKNFVAIVTMSIDPTVKLPDDTAAIISSDSLLGGRYLELQPGGSDVMMKAGDRIQYTQSPQNLEQLLGKFIFNMGGKKDDKGASADPTPAPDAAAQAMLPPPLAAPSKTEEPKIAEPEVQEKPEPASQAPTPATAPVPAATPDADIAAPIDADKAAQAEADRLATEKAEQMEKQQLAPEPAGGEPAPEAAPQPLEPAPSDDASGIRIEDSGTGVDPSQSSFESAPAESSPAEQAHP